MRITTLALFLQKRKERTVTENANELGVSRQTLSKWSAFSSKVLISKTDEGWECYPIHSYGKGKR